MDWKEKIKELEKRGLSLQVEKNEKIVFESHESRLKPLFLCSKLFGSEMDGSTVIDKVIGKAAAFICILRNVKAVYTPVASESAKILLAEKGIDLQAKKVIPEIRNSNKTDQCPMEKMADAAGSPELFYKELEARIKIE